MWVDGGVAFDTTARSEPVERVAAGEAASICAMRMSPHLITTSTAVCLGLALSACGGTTIDSAKAEKLVTGAPGIKTASCPSGVKPKAGGTYVCDFTALDGRTGTVTLHMKDDKGRVEAQQSDFHVK